LDKFEARSVDGIFFGYATHYRAFVCSTLNLTKSWRFARWPSTRHNDIALWSFKCAGDDEFGKEMFEEGVQEH
jgi:hypothetical protein